FQADCKKKFLIVRSADRSIDTMWEVMPDGSFYVTMDGGPTRFVAPMSCTAYTKLDLVGRLNCQDRDKVTVEVDAIWWLNKGVSRPASDRTADTAGASCNVAESCYLHTQLNVKQCP